MAEAGRRVAPAATVICMLGDEPTLFTFRIGFTMTTEELKSTCLGAYRLRCRDDGLPFAPPSLDPSEYELTPSLGDGTPQAHHGPLPGAAEGAPPLRVQMARLPSPLTLVFRVGQRWLAREAMVAAEAQQRSAIEARCWEALNTLRFVCDVDEERQLDAQVLRHTQERLVAPIETLMLELYLQYNAYVEKVNHEQTLLAELYRRFSERVSPESLLLERMAAEERRRHFNASTVAVRTLAAAGSL